MMDRINRILKHTQYREYVFRISELEKERVFCRHNLEHFFSVARLAWILNMEMKYNIDKESIYAAGLLHDIGRHMQYEVGTPHELASEQLAEPILSNCGFSEAERTEILTAIREHRNRSSLQTTGLTELIYRADKMSRPCFLCEAADECKKTKDRNIDLIW